MLRTLRHFLAKRQISRAFGAYLSPSMVNQMVEAGERPALGGAEVDLSAMFVDMQGYVGIAEQVPVRRLSEFMNAYFEGCTNAIQAENGTLDKYIGDVIVVMFGAPVSFSDHALRAC